MSYTTTSSNGEELGQTESNFDRVFDALGHQYRRRLLSTIDKAGTRDRDELFLKELTFGTDDRERYTAQLVHVHLPKLAEMGYLEWDREGNTVTRGENYNEVAPLITLMREHANELPADLS